MKIQAIVCSPPNLTLTWSDASTTDFPLIWLRDNDPDELHPHTRERTFDLTTVDLDILPNSQRLEDDYLVLQWPERKEESRYAGQWLYASRPGAARHDPAKIELQLWDRTSLTTIPRFHAGQCARNPQILLEALREAKRTGLVIFHSLDATDLAGEQFGNVIGFKRQSNFGVMFNVVNKPSPNNLAYTSLALPLHTDLPNQESIPGYQFLHCVKNTVTGGESVFGDGFQICSDLRKQRPDYFKLLSQIQLPWRFHDEDHDIRRRRPIIHLGPDGEMTCFAFNAHIADVPDMDSETLHDFYAAYHDLMLRIRNPAYRLCHALAPGEMVMFDNHRVLHGREAFDPGSGERHFRGFYIEQNEVDSRLRILAR